MKESVWKAKAKINLGLDVLRRRPDGYHDLRMIMQSVSLHDQIILRESTAPGIRVSSSLASLPTDRNNLVYRAAQLLMEEFSTGGGLEIRLEKQIPVAAGLAGGSSDAAAVLKGVNEMFSLGLSLEELMQRGVRIGADVPYCLLGGTALAEGIGEILTPLPDAPHQYVVLVKPPIDVSTGFVYGNLKADQLQSHPDIDGQVRAIRAQDAAAMAQLMGNVLESVTIPAHPVIAAIREQLLGDGAVNAMMSGSGPTVFALYNDRAAAEKACERMQSRDRSYRVILTEFASTI